MKLFYTTVFSLLLCAAAFAQKVEVSESSESFSVGRQPAIVAVFQHSDKDKIEKEWKSLIKSFKPDDVNDKKGEYFFDNAKFTSLGNNTVDVHSIVMAKGKDDEIRLTVCFDLGGAYASGSSHSKEMSYFKNMVKDFAVKMTKDHYDDKVKEASKALTKLNDKQADLEKDNKGLEKDIVDYNDRIKKSQEKIELNKKEIETKKTEVGAQQKVLDGLKSKQSSVN
ncbi:MAG: hypothetical protein K0S33_2621 [Bacteroidetes bacterium]|jgi:hypothetical protein|nr:hypothetical protein [Bacteroidota bacterium]